MAEDNDSPELPDEYDELDAETVLLECICEAVNDLFAHYGFAPFDRGSEIVDADIGSDICCGRITITGGRYRRRQGPGWVRDTMDVTIRMTRAPDTRCSPDFCKDGVHRCHISPAGRMLKRERLVIRNHLDKWIRKGCGKCCSNPQLLEVRPFYSVNCGGHMVTIRIDC